MRLATPRSFYRIGLLLLVLGLTLLICWSIMIRMPLESHSGPLPLLTAEQLELSEELRQDVQHLAETIGERNVYLPRRLALAVEFIEQSFEQAGYSVQRHTYNAQGEPSHNLETQIPGRTRPGEIVLVGAHYDSVHGSPGANDNGSGTAALLALARSFAGQPGVRTLRFVAFANEEPPFFHTELMGSLVYARLCRDRGDNIVAMLSLETIGYFRHEPGSQKYPFPVGMFYPSTGNFVAFVGNTSSRDLVREAVASFRRHAAFPSEGAALPSALPGIGWSDHWSFWQAGYPAIMITDTAPFRYPWYHQEEDIPGKLDYESMARIVSGVRAVVYDLVNSPE